MKRAAIAAALAGGMIAAGCSGGAGVTPKVNAPTERHADGPVSRLAVADVTRSLSGEPGGMAADNNGAVVEVDDNTVVAFDTASQERWSVPVHGAALGWLSLTDQLVVVPTLTASDLGEDRDPGYSAAVDSGGCVALDRATGARRWSYEEAGKSGVSVASEGPRVFCVFSDGVIAAIDRDTGELLWRVVIDTRVRPASIYVAERSAIAIDPASGTMSLTVQWGGWWMLIVRDLATGASRANLHIVDGPISSPALATAGVIAFGGVDEICLRTMKSEKTVCYGIHAPDGFDPASVPVAADGVVVFAASDGSVSAVDVATQKILWGKLLPTPVLDTRLVISDGVVLFPDFTRNPWALRMSDGSKVTVPSPDGFVSATAADAAGGFAVALRADVGGRVDRWVPER